MGRLKLGGKDKSQAGAGAGAGATGDEWGVNEDSPGANGAAVSRSLRAVFGSVHFLC